MIRIGLVCPYALDVPGGVQNHVLGLAAHLWRSGLDVGVLAPGVPDPARLRSAGLPADLVTSAGPAWPVPYNGSVARVDAGPRTAARVRRWLDTGEFDLLHLHEPITPSAALHALRSATAPVVATFHTATPRSRSLQLAGRVLRPLVERIDADIAVSDTARRVVVRHLGRDAVIIPNGFDHAAFATASSRRRAGGPLRLAYLGRLDEPRKGLDVLVGALPALRRRFGSIEVVVAGQGQAALPADCRRLGQVDDAERAALLAGAEVFVAPHRGRESFGLVLIEAMTAGAAVVASNLPAFADLLGPDGGLGFTFTPGEPAGLAAAVERAMASDRPALARRAVAATRRFDWSVVGPQVEQVYAGVLGRPLRPARPELELSVTARG